MATAKKLWDIPTRLIHWTVAGTITLNLFVLETGDDWHRWLGYLAFAAVSVRMLWGFFGASGASRLYTLPLRPRQLVVFLGELFKWKKVDYPSHNPGASYVYLAIWASVFVLAVSGFMMETDRFWGEEWVQEVHSNIADFLTALIVFHLVGILIDAIKFRRATWFGMITGRKGL